MTIEDIFRHEPSQNRLLPLAGVKVIEFSGLGPTPFGAMMLADFGADVVRIQKQDHVNPLGGDPELDFLYRNRPVFETDLKSAADRRLIEDLSGHADVLIEGFRPGTMEKLGLGPETLCARNDRLIYARMSGWGQDGPLSKKAGHDINYLALSGGLHAMGPFGSVPSPPLNLVGNFGGGGMLLAFGILAALNERNRSGLGQVIDVSMFDGITTLLTQLSGWSQMGQWSPGRGNNLLDGSAYFYRCYRTKDERYVAVGALEKPFHDAFIAGLDLQPEDFADHLNYEHWEHRSKAIEAIIAARSMQEWDLVYADTDACVTPVLTLEEAAFGNVGQARETFVMSGTTYQPSPAPRFSRSTCRRPGKIANKGNLGTYLADNL